MRITSSMITTKMLMNINRNEVNMDRLDAQYVSGKKANVPSDDPIVASRALKFRANYNLTEQYLRNVTQGISWMEITEESFVNALDVMQKISELSNQGATGTLEYADKQKIVTLIEELSEQLGGEMNIDYTGRYVYSGYRTDEPAIVKRDDQTAKYNIHQFLDFTDIEKVKVTNRAPQMLPNGTIGTPDTTNPPSVYEVYRLKLPYSTGLTLNSIDVPDPTVSPQTNPPTMLTCNGITVPKNANNAYVVDDNYNFDDGQTVIAPDGLDYHFIAETGEIIFSEAFIVKMRQNSVTDIMINYDKVGLKAGEVNPRVYFNCTDNSPVDTVYHPNVPYDFKQTIDDWEINTSGRAVKSTKSTQELTFEFGINTRIRVNTLAADTYSASLCADLLRIAQDVNAMELTSDSDLQAKYTQANFPGKTEEELKIMLQTQKSEEIARFNSVIYSMFNNMLEISSKHEAALSKEDTSLGARMIRMELINERMEADRLTYFNLMSKNEDIDYAEVMMNLKNAENIYLASLKAGASMITQSLLDYMR